MIPLLLRVSLASALAAACPVGVCVGMPAPARAEHAQQRDRSHTPGSDTTRPRIPSRAAPDDSLYVVRDSSDTQRVYYRRLFDVVFSDATPVRVIRAFLAKYRAEIVGGIPLRRAYTVRTSDPGPGWDAFMLRLAALRAESGVELVSRVTRRDYPVRLLRPGAAEGGDTARPVVPAAGYWPSGTDTLRLVADRRFPEIVYYRDLFDVGFADSASGRTVRGFMARNRATILGGSRWLGDYTVRVPDPGPSQDAFDSLVVRLSREPGVEYAAPITHRPGRMREGGLDPGFAPRVDTQGAVASRPPLDTTRLVFLADSTAIYRTDILLSFKDGVSDSTEAAFFARHGMIVLRRIRATRVFFVRIPDPGPELQGFWDVLQSLNREPEVNAASFIPRQPLEQVVAAPSASDSRSAESPRVAPLSADTGRPAVPSNLFAPDDPLHTVSDPSNPDDVYYRTFVAVIFDDTASGNSVRAFLRKYHASVVGGLPSSRGYIIQFADPGASWASLQALLHRMGAESGVFVVMPEMRSGKPPEPDGRRRRPPA